MPEFSDIAQAIVLLIVSALGLNQAAPAIKRRRNPSLAQPVERVVSDDDWGELMKRVTSIEVTMGILRTEIEHIKETQQEIKQILKDLSEPRSTRRSRGG